MGFYEKLRRAWEKSGSMVCVGLDPDLARIPESLRAERQPLLAFNKAIVEATADIACAYKPQAAYYSAIGAEAELEETIRFIHERAPNVPVILDAKRGDIGSTAERYAAEAFDRYKADAVTVNPYMGSDTLKPFLDRADKGVVILCRTSNPGSGDFQSLDVGGGKKLCSLVAEKAAMEWNANSNAALVVGATYPEELREIRGIVGDMPLLVPGVGAQGGDPQAVVKNGADSQGQGLIVNSSRAILYADSGPGFAEAARKAAICLRDALRG